MLRERTKRKEQRAKRRERCAGLRDHSPSRNASSFVPQLRDYGATRRLERRDYRTTGPKAKGEKMGK